MRIAGGAAAKVFVIFVFLANFNDASGTEVPQGLDEKAALEPLPASAGADPLLVDEESPLLRRMGPTLRRDTTPRPWVLLPHTYEILGREYELHVLGYIKLDVMHDFDSMGQGTGFPNYFVPSEIPVRGAKTAGRGPRTGVTWNSSRLETGLGTSTPLGDVKTLLDFNFLRNSTGRPAFNLRQFFLELKPFRGGKSWTTFINLESIPDTLDYQGPNALPEARHPLLRWTQPLAVGPLADVTSLQDLSLALAVEWSSGSLYLPPGMKTESPIPDFVASLQYEKGNGSVWLSGIYRRFKASGNGSSSEAEGWGIQLAGNIPVKNFASIQFGAIYGAGLGSYLNDVQALDLDGALDSSGKLRVIPAVSAWIAGQYWWRIDLRSSISYGYVYLSDDFVATLPGDTEGIFKQSHYASANLIWSPIPPLDVGIEYLFGYRQNNDRRSGIDNRLQFSVILHFSSGDAARGPVGFWDRLIGEEAEK